MQAVDDEGGEWMKDDKFKDDDLKRKLVPVFLGTHFVPDMRVLRAKELLRPDEAADILRVSRNQVYELCASGDLSSIKVGHSTRIRSSSVLRMIGKSA
jgi:excisionase family DNA binding protein